MTVELLAIYQEFATERQERHQHILKLRQQRGWQVAQQAAQLLETNFATRKVLLFGSLLDYQRMYRHSDIDLAVWGLSDDSYYQAVSQVLKLDPEFSIDLVQFESTSPAIRHAILTTGVELDESCSLNSPTSIIGKLSMAYYAPLIGQIQQELAELDEITQQTSRLLQKVLHTGDEDYLSSLTLNLHSFYTATERIFREIVQRIDGQLPEGADWHRRLLRQISAEIPNVRPPVITIKTRDCLDEYCAFRHVVRNIYTFNLRLERIQPLTANLPDCYQRLKQDCEAFCQTLSFAIGRF